MYIHSIPQKKIEGYLRSECYFSILVLFRGYFDTHTHTLLSSKGSRICFQNGTVTQDLPPYVQISNNFQLFNHFLGVTISYC